MHRPFPGLRPLARAFFALPLLAAFAGAQTAADSGWRPLFNGTNFNGLYAYAMNTGVQDIPADSPNVRIGAQTAVNAMFRVDSGMIRVGGTPTGYIGTVRQYAHYRMRVQYRWPVGTAANANAGLIVHLDSAQVRAPGFNNTLFRPRSIEVNMKRDEDHPWTLWASTNLGPAFSSTVNDSSITIPRYSSTGAQSWTVNPSGKRTLASSLANPELPAGQWNTGMAEMRGDSGIFTLNGQVRTRARRIRNSATAAGAAAAAPYIRGGLGLQSEGTVLHYRNFEIQELDSVTGLPLHATTSLRARWARNEAAAPRLAHGAAWVDLPAGRAGFDLHDLQGRKVWSYRGAERRARVPAEAGNGLMWVRFIER